MQAGTDAIGQGIGAVGAGMGTIGSAIGQTAQADFNCSHSTYQQFMDPFTEDVIATTQADIARQGAYTKSQHRCRCCSRCVWWFKTSSCEQEIARNVMDQQARTGSQLRSQGFAQAQNCAAQQAAQQQLKQAQLTGQLGSTTGALGQTVGQLGTATAGLGQLGQADGRSRY